MRSPQGNRNELLDDVLADEIDGDRLSADTVIALIHREHVIRQHRRNAARLAGCAFLCIAALVVLCFDRWSNPGTQVSSLRRSPASVESHPNDIVIKRIGDEELLEFIDQPVALVRFPNGDRKLILLTQWEPRAGGLQ